MSLDILRCQVDKETPLGEKNIFDRHLQIPIKLSRQFYNKLYSTVNKTLCQQHISTIAILGRVNADKVSIVSQLKMSLTGDSLVDFPQEATVRTPSGRVSEPARFWELGGRN